MAKWIYVCLPYATFAIQVQGGVVIAAPPIAKWMQGKQTVAIRQWIDKKGGYWEMLFEGEA